MSFNGSEKEFLVTLSLGEEKVIEKELGINLVNVQYEKHFPGMKIDMYAISSLGIEVFVENLLTKSNKTHQNKIIKIIEMIESGIIIYIASAFQKQHINELQDKVRKSGKPITLYFAVLNSNIFEPLQQLNNMHKLKVFENLNLLNIKKPVQFLEKESIVQPIVTKRLVQKEINDELTVKRKKENEYLLETLRNQIPYFLPFYRQKAHLEKLRIISFGAGRSDCNYYVSLSDRRNLAFIELRFSKKNSEIYNAIKEKISIVQKRFNNEVRFKDNSISVTIKPLENIEDTVNKIVVIFEKMIIAFSNYTYYYYMDKEKMWQHHQYGI